MRMLNYRNIFCSIGDLMRMIDSFFNSPNILHETMTNKITRILMLVAHVRMSILVTAIVAELLRPVQPLGTYG